MDNTYLVILGMALVTYLPRAIPLVFFNNLKIPALLQRFLKYVPFAILGALIFPGIFSSTGQILPSILGCLAAFSLAWLEINILFIVLGSILLTVLVQII